MSYLFGGTPFDGYDAGGRRSINGGGGGGPSSTTTTTTNIPTYLKAPTQRMVARGEELSEQAYTPYAGERTASFDPMQTQAFSALAGMGAPSQFDAAGQSVTGAQQFGTAGALGAMGYQPTQFNQYQMQAPGAINAGTVQGTGYNAYGIQAAPDVAGTSYEAAQAAYTPQWNAQTAQQYMDPYQQAVTDIQKREATTEAQRLNQELAGKAAKSGAFGGSRFGIEQAMLGKSLATNLADIQAKGSQSAYAAGMGQFNTEQAQRQAINLANQGALNQAGQFGASQAQSAALANQQVRQQANLESQRAYNQALQFGATQEQAAALANQQANLTASQANQQMQYQTGLQNLQAALTTQQQQDAARQAAANLNLQGAQFGAQTGLSAAERLGALGTASQAADLQRIAAQQSAGAQQQALQQQKLDTAYQQAIEQRDWEKNQLGFLSGLIRGTPFSTQQMQSAPTASTTSQLASLGLGAYGLSSLLGKKDGGAIKGYAKGGSVAGYADGGSVDMYPDQVLQAVVAGKSDVVPVPDAQRELRRRALLRTAAKGQEAQQTLADQRSLADRVEEEAGVAGLPAGNMEFADGGILGYADGGDVVHFDAGGNTSYGYRLPQGYDPAIYEMYEDPTSGEVYPRKRYSGMAAYGANIRAAAQGKPSPVPVEKPAPTAADTTKKPDEAPAGPAQPPKATPGSPAAANVANKLATQQDDYADIKKLLQANQERNAKLNEALGADFAEAKNNVEGMRGDIKGIAALRAAAAIAQGGPGGTWAQLGRGLGAAGEEAARGINQIQAARQGLLGQQLQMAQLQRQADSGDVTAQLALRELQQKGPLYAAQAGFYNRDRGMGGGQSLAATRLELNSLDKDIKNYSGQAQTPQVKQKLIDLQRRKEQLLAGISGSSAYGLGAAPKGAIQYEAP